MSFNKKSIILHVGLYKTGSTFIQNHLKYVKQNDLKIYLRRSDPTFVKMINNYLEKPNKKLYKNIRNILNKEKYINFLRKAFWASAFFL